MHQASKFNFVALVYIILIVRISYFESSLTGLSDSLIKRNLLVEVGQAAALKTFKKNVQVFETF